MRCARCQHENLAGSTFCAQCGAPLAAAAQAPPAPAAPRRAPSVGVPGLLLFGIVMLILGAAGAYFALKGGHATPAGLPGLAPMPAQPAAPALPAMQAYSDPAGHFTIDYPQDWHASQVEESTCFYRGASCDEYQAGALRVKPPKVIPHEVHADQVLADLTKDVSSAERVSNRKVQTDAAGVETGSVDISSSSEPGGPVQGRANVRVAHPAAGSTVVWEVDYVARQDAFPSLEPVFDHMFRSYRPK